MFAKGVEKVFKKKVKQELRKLPRQLDTSFPPIQNSQEGGPSGNPTMLPGQAAGIGR